MKLYKALTFTLFSLILIGHGPALTHAKDIDIDIRPDTPQKQQTITIPAPSAQDKTARIMSHYFHMTCLDSFFAPSRMFAALPDLGFEEISSDNAAAEEISILRRSLNASDDSQVWISNFDAAFMILVLDREKASCHLASSTRATPSILFTNFEMIAKSINRATDISMKKTQHDLITQPTTISYDYTLAAEEAKDTLHLGALISVNPDETHGPEQYGTVSTLYFKPAADDNADDNAAAPEDNN